MIARLCMPWLLAGSLIAAWPSVALPDQHWPSSRLAQMVQKAHGLGTPPIIAHAEHLDETLLVVFSRGPADGTLIDVVSKPKAKLVRLTALAEKSASVSFGSNWGLRIAEVQGGGAAGTTRDISIIYGHIPFADFSEVEISWNCKVPEAKTLTDSGFFFFIRNGAGWRRCKTMYLYDESGQRHRIAQDKASRAWMPVKAE